MGFGPVNLEPGTQNGEPLSVLKPETRHLRRVEIFGAFSVGKEIIMIPRLITLAGLMLLPALALGQPPDAGQLDKLYLKSGLADLVDQIPAGVQAGFAQAFNQDSKGSLSRQQRKIIHARIPMAYASDDMRPGIIAALAAKLTAADVEAVMDWLDSPLGRKCTALESAAATPEALAAMQAYAVELQQSPPPPEQVALLGELARAVKATENAVEVVMNTQLAIAVGMSAMLPAEQRKPLEVIRYQLEQFRPQVTAAMQDQTILAFLYTYRDLSEDEIQKYLKFARSDVGARYHAAAADGIQQALTAGSLKLGAMITEIIQATEKQSDI